MLVIISIAEPESKTFSSDALKLGFSDNLSNDIDEYSLIESDLL